MPTKAPSHSALAELSSQLAAAVDTAGRSVVAIHARRRIPSSGIIWRDGVLVSASHTVQRDDGFEVTLPDGTRDGATVAGRDPATDIVVMRVSKAKQVATIPDTMPRVGLLALAIGRPGTSVTASFGIVSAAIDQMRNAHGARMDRVLRLDLNIYDGFSGGALADATGAVVGMNNSAIARGTALALSTPTIDRVVDEILAHGHVRRPFIGVAVHPVQLPAALARLTEGARDAALLVTAIAENGPADRAGVLVGDVIVSVNGQPLNRMTDMLDALAATGSGTSVTLDLLRGGSKKSVSVTPEDRGGRE